MSAGKRPEMPYWEYRMNDDFSIIKKRWLKTHLWLNIGVSALLLAIEVIIYILIKCLDVFSVPESEYVVKYLFAPILANGACVAMQLVCWKSRLSETVKMYIISLGLALTCFIAYSVHCYYYIIIFIFVIPVVLTVVYGDTRLTYITSVVSFALEIIAEFFVFWDPTKEYALTNGDCAVKFSIAVAIQLALFYMCRVIIKYEIEKNDTLRQKEQERCRLQKELYVDPLTGIFNRGALRGRFDEMIANRKTSRYFFVMADIDRFKMTNDKLGHLVGDGILRQLGGIFRRACTAGVPFRYGGDEFCLLYKDVPLERVLEECKEIQARFQESQSGETKELEMSISFGIASYDGEMPPSQLVRLADRELYIAKQTRGCISMNGALL